jgi:hypothetical protein
MDGSRRKSVRALWIVHTPHHHHLHHLFSKGSRPIGQALRCRGNYTLKAQEHAAVVSRETRVREKSDKSLFLPFLVWVFGFAIHYHFIINLTIDYYHLLHILFQITHSFLANKRFPGLFRWRNQEIYWLWISCGLEPTTKSFWSKCNRCLWHFVWQDEIIIISGG